MRGLFLGILCYAALTPGWLLNTAAAQTLSASATDPSSAAPGPHDSEETNIDTSTGDSTNNTSNPGGVVGPAGHYLFTSPIAIHPNAVRIGPLQIFDLSTSGFFEAATGVDGKSQNLWGSTLASTLGMTKISGKSQLTISASPAVSVTGTQPYVNAGGGVNFTYNLTPRWTLAAGGAVSYSQLNSLLLQNPQYFLTYVNGGYAVQTLYAQTIGSSLYANTNFSANYLLSGRTQISFSPQLGLTLQDESGNLQFLHNLGFQVSVSREMTPSRTAWISYGFSRAITSDGSYTSNASGWNNQTFGGGFQQKIGTRWSVSANLAASYQNAGTAGWTPTGGVSVSRTFQNGSLAAAYNRTVSSQVFVSSGYIDQTTISYGRQLGRKIGLSLGGSEFRTIAHESHQTGRNFNVGTSYPLRPSVNVTVSYGYIHQESTQSLLYNGNTSILSFGLVWVLEHTPAK
jgi:hypothetical protein